ncbi:MAG: SAM-dependent methyltransferase [Treponema sp.]|nr:SAM-dependent methyltransferase [Treponema sp.]
MILSVTLSKPAKNISEILGENYVRIKIKRNVASNAKPGEEYLAEFFTAKQVFHKKFSESSLASFLDENAGKTFKSCVERTEDAEIQILSNKKGKITCLERKRDFSKSDFSKSDSAKSDSSNVSSSDSEKKSVSLKNIMMKNAEGGSKNYILKDGIPVPFLVRLGIQTAQGKVISSKFDKFRQINRFLEFVDDVLPSVMKIREEKNDSSPIRVVDFGSGKSYLTFAVHYFLTQIKKIDCEVFGLDLKKDVIEYCSALASELAFPNLKFAVGDISDYSGSSSPDIVVTLHACDTATDFALDYSVKRGVSAILSVPCCQHEINSQLAKSSVPKDSPFEPFLRFGLIKERFAALATDAIRAELLEKSGYKVQVLEFIDAENTPKNLLIRAVKNENCEGGKGFSNLMSVLNINQTLENLLGAKQNS